MKAKFSDAALIKESDIDRVFQAIKDNPNCNTAKIGSATGLGFRKIVTAVEYLVANGKVSKHTKASRSVILNVTEE